MIYDTEYKNVEEVKKMIENCPVMIDFGNLSEDVKDLLFDIHEYVDAMAGYADWYMLMKEPLQIYDGAFLDQDFWKRFEDVKSRTYKEQDIVALEQIVDIAKYLKQLTILMFK